MLGLLFQSHLEARDRARVIRKITIGFLLLCLCRRMFIKRGRATVAAMAKTTCIKVLLRILSIEKAKKGRGIQRRIICYTLSYCQQAFLE